MARSHGMVNIHKIACFARRNESPTQGLLWHTMHIYEYNMIYGQRDVMILSWYYGTCLLTRDVNSLTVAAFLWRGSKCCIWKFRVVSKSETTKSFRKLMKMVFPIQSALENCLPMFSYAFPRLSLLKLLPFLAALGKEVQEGGFVHHTFLRKCCCR